MSRTLRKYKYILIQAEQIFAISILSGILAQFLFGFITGFDNGFQAKEFLNASVLILPSMGIFMLSIMIGSYYQLLCPFYLSFSSTRKSIYLNMKAIALIPLAQLFLLSLILAQFAEEASKATAIASYPGLLGISFIGLSLGECMGALSLKFVKFGRIFPGLLGGIGGGIGGFSASYFADAEREFSISAIITDHADILLVIGIGLYLIVNILVYRTLKKLTT